LGAAICPISGSVVHLPPTASQLLLWALLPESLCGELPLPPSPVCSKHSTLSAACPFLFLIYYSVLFFLRGGGQSVQGAILVYPRGGCGNTVCCLFAHLLVCIAQAGLEPSSSEGILLFSQCNIAWRSFLWVGGSGCQSFAYSWWSFSAKCGSSITERFLIYGAHTVCFLPLVAILDLPPSEF
jgi:hypothetical protein